MNKPATTKLKALRLLAPISGTAIPLSEVVDPLVNQGLLGPGIAIAPVGNRVVAPCKGRVTSIAATSHQLTLTDNHGVKITIIIGHDGLTTHGLGYIKKVKLGDFVVPGQILVELDTLKLKAQLSSLVVAIIINKGALKLVPNLGTKRAGEDEILKLVVKEQIKETQ
jgi:glucose-specific phosphotransferase system IIA component